MICELIDFISENLDSPLVKNRTFSDIQALIDHARQLCQTLFTASEVTAWSSEALSNRSQRRVFVGFDSWSNVCVAGDSDSVLLEATKPTYNSELSDP